MVDIPHDSFAARRSICAVQQVDHINHLEGISLNNWQKMPCERAGKTDGVEYIDLAYRGLNFAPPDCASWLLDREEDRPINIFATSKGLFPMLTG